MVVLERDVSILSVVDKSPRFLLWQSLVLDLDHLMLRAGDTVIPASTAEFNLLRLLITQRHVPLAREYIMDCLFGSEHGRDLRQADFLVARLRRLLAPIGLGQAISTVAGRGYTLTDASGTADPAVDHLALLAA